MLKDNEKITIFRNAKTYDATVLGSDGNLFWLLVLDLAELQRGHLNNVFEHRGMKCLSGSEWNHKIKYLFDVNGELKDGAFSASITPPEHVISQVKMYKLLDAFRPSAD